MKQNIFWFITCTIIAISGFMASNNFAYGQVTENLTAQPVLNEWIKIINPIEGQQVPVGKELIVSGESSDNVFKNCTVSVIANNIKPYQNAHPSAAAESGDYSKWIFTLSSNYTDILEGPNRITAKLSCPESNRWYSVNPIGVPTGKASMNVSSPDFTPSVLGATNESAKLTPPSVQQESSTPPPSPEATSRPAASGQNTKTISVVFDILNNPAPRGSDQNITITVSDAASNESIPGATITGKLLYPGDNYVKDFSGTTDPNGHFVYHWKIGENGDAGELTIEAQVVASGYEPREARSAFQITEG